jgi:hypothetical protein
MKIGYVEAAILYDKIFGVRRDRSGGCCPGGY